ncbi:MAG: hypothetical protein M1819_004258 [Sarea resinae]|nr:MAG: hypothetical protein M1819_004258 [Sarea resinae]
MRSPQPVPIRLISHNIRYATQSPFKGEKPWEARRSRLIDELRFNTFGHPEAFICLQEVLHNQLTDVLSALNRRQSSHALCTPPEDWAFIGVGREDGREAGEYSPIFYRPSVWKLESFRSVWLSETPEKPSRGWDASSTRILTIGIFEHRESKKRVVAMNTHLDDSGSVSRYESAKIILAEIGRSIYDRGGDGISMAPPLPVFVAGDFNSETGQEAYQTLNDGRSPIKDLRDYTEKDGRYGHENTFTGFGYEKEPEKRIDFIFVGPKDGVTSNIERKKLHLAQWHVDGYAVLESRFEDGVYNSDHRAVVGDVYLI